MNKRKFVYVTYIASTPDKVWEALTNSEMTEQYFFGTRVESDWKEGSTIKHTREGAGPNYGNILKFDPPNELSFTWTYEEDTSERDLSVVTFTLQQMESTVKLTLKHDNLIESEIVEKEDTFEGYNNGWPAIMSNLKTLLETGKTLPAVVV
ncbi:SRPBCC family protein [Fictibacillus nanhaiensis]|uniref:SRPBCC family protein n=1 Tax=Fictibacillus nanhaiensis TaxID=742169 RepID=UPI001C95CA80|nr:SRPBCC family protein [Fictibacillus nanhaiensis]MBY6037585.1 SRPBCC family protein [Fictibacillus nanhaiensis]